jgi:hypothetical protein
MKNTFKLSSLLAFIVIASGCLNNKNSSNPIPVPTGTFSGQFTSLHKKANTSIVDTLRANIQLTTTSAGLFKVSGDTATVHAGSHGSFQLNSAYIQFQDSTATAHNTKVHLNGLYQYAYDGNNFQITAYNDTLYYEYDLKRN